jgi:hypothetical protein
MWKWAVVEWLLTEREVAYMVVGLADAHEYVPAHYTT